MLIIQKYMKYQLPKYQVFHLKGILHISPDTAFGLIKKEEALLIDVREPEETDVAKADLKQGVIEEPLSGFTKTTAFSKEKLLVVMCAHGIRSAQVCHWLIGNGYQNVVNLDGGFTNWQAMNLPVSIC
jgi:rhodanese-related sulfurtransferase